MGELWGARARERVGGAIRALKRRPPDSGGTDPKKLQQLVLEALQRNPSTRLLGVDVRVSAEGIVELTGAAPDELAREIAGETARAVPEADVVINLILVEGKDLPEQSVESAIGSS